MQIPILIETLSAKHFRASAPAPFSVDAEGKSSAEAVGNLRARIENEFVNGKRIGVLDVSLPDENPWIKFAGHLKDEPLVDEWQAAIAEYRRKRDPDDE